MLSTIHARDNLCSRQFMPVPFSVFLHLSYAAKVLKVQFVFKRNWSIHHKSRLYNSILTYFMIFFFCFFRFLLQKLFVFNDKCWIRFIFSCFNTLSTTANSTLKASLNAFFNPFFLKIFFFPFLVPTKSLLLKIVLSSKFYH